MKKTEIKRAIKILSERYKHQYSEVVEARKKLGQVGYTKSYLNKMVSNCKQTEKSLKHYKILLSKTNKRK